jgi:hypothetical protein
MASTVRSSQQFNSKFFWIAGTALAQPIKFGPSPPLMMFTRPLIDPQCNSSQDGINDPLIAVKW